MGKPLLVRKACKWRRCQFAAHIVDGGYPELFAALEFSIEQRVIRDKLGDGLHDGAGAMIARQASVR
jgi:hypothetical protein